jgi:2-polyprenyl-6-methoxyphenol hydroxylase-like FAD-dependent oxidoreductase
VETALREYERRRIPRTAAIIRNSWQSGRILQLDYPTLEALRNWLMGTSIGNRLAMKMFGNLLTYKIPLSRLSA